MDRPANPSAAEIAAHHTAAGGAPPLPSPPPDPGRNRFAFASWLFLRLLASIHLIAFVSFWTQLDALVGPRGLLPATRYFAAVREQLGGSAFAQLPSLCWWFGTEKFPHVLCAAGVALALLLFAGVAPVFCLGLLWVAYLSLSCAGQIFFNFQWDALLLETTVLALLLAPWKMLPLWRPHEPPRFARLILWWLLFRLMFLAGVVKLASGDPTWRNLSALTFHYETQPLPTLLGWFAHQLPTWWHRASCAGMFVIELVVPFFLFAPRALRHNASLILAGLMVAIALTGNYTFFNLLAIALCLLCLDDAWWRAVRGCASPKTCNVLRYIVSRFRFRALFPDAKRGVPPDGQRAPRWPAVSVASLAALAFVYTLVQALPSVMPRVALPPVFRAMADAVAPFRSLNNYGLFAVMTNPRPELIFEGSDDGRAWHAYEFPDKPGDLLRRPTWVAPHQPRLDWQLWFAALGPPQHNPWVLALCEQLLRGNRTVLPLLANNPFPDKPPRYVRVVRYEYHFTDAAARRATGRWWRRTPLDFYVAPVSLR